MNIKAPVTKIIVIVLLIALALISAFPVASKRSSFDTNAHTIEYLDAKQVTVTKIAAGSAIVSTALAAVPGDATTPVANEVMDLASYLVLILAAIFLEKYLVTTLALAAFKYIIPIACAIGITGTLLSHSKLKELAAKLIIFAIVLAFVIPWSVIAGEKIDETYRDTIERASMAAEAVDEAVTETNTQQAAPEKEDKGFFGNLLDIVSNTATNIAESVADTAGRGVETAKNMMKTFTEGIAVLLVTSCVIPILVVAVAMWAVKLIFGLDIAMPERPRRKDE